MVQAAVADGMAVSNDDELWDYLSALPAEMSGELGYRAGLRALGDVARHGELSEATARYTLAACRAVLTAGVLVERPGDAALRKAAAEAAKASQQVRVYHNKLVAERAPAADAMVRVISGLEAALAPDRARAADLAGHAMAGDVSCYDDCELEPEELRSTPIEVVPETSGLFDQFAASDAWAFWRAWHDEAMKATPLPWGLQAEIARLPQDAWDAGPAVIAGRIGRIFARVELVARIDALEKRMQAAPEPDMEDGEADTHAAAGFAAVRLIREPIEDLLSQARSPKPQPFLIQKATVRLSTVLAASGKWLGRAAEGEIKDMVRMIGKGGGVATASWIDAQAPHIRAVIQAAEDWRHRLPA